MVRTRALLVAAVLTLPVLAVACGAAQEARDDAIAKVTDGTWACTDDDGEAELNVEADDGDFTLKDPNPEKGEEDEAPGSWKVVGKSVRASISTKDGKSVFDIRGFDDLTAKAGSITVEDPKRPKLTSVFDIEVKGANTIVVAPQDEKRWPSAPWTCKRQ